MHHEVELVVALATGGANIPPGKARDCIFGYAVGLDLTRRILSLAGPFLRASGLLIVEVGNSWTTLEEAYPQVPFTWVEFEHGGEGVFTLTAKELQEYSTNWRG